MQNTLYFGACVLISRHLIITCVILLKAKVRINVLPQDFYGEWPLSKAERSLFGVAHVAFAKYQRHRAS